MAMLPDVFNTADNKSSAGAIIPAGWYTAEAIKSELKATKAGDGKYISFYIRIVEGEYEGKMVFDNMNIVNKSTPAVEIGRAKLAYLAEACGVEAFEDTQDLHMIPIMVKIGVDPAKGDWPEKNKVLKYMSISEFEEKTSSEDESDPF